MDELIAFYERRGYVRTGIKKPFPYGDPRFGLPKRKDLQFDWMFVCFAVFIVACGATHLMEIWTIWEPVYWLSGAIKAITALASVPTAILLVRLIPQALRIPSPAALRSPRGLSCLRTAI